MATGYCSIYGDRPKECVAFPTINDEIPSGCGYFFANGVRKGSCTPDVCEGENCCARPRFDGEPTKVCPKDSDTAGVPCKNLRWEESDEDDDQQVKVANDQEVSEYHSQIEEAIKNAT